jgi:hypothetical protein
MNEQPTPGGRSAEPTLAEVRAQFPGWHCIQGSSELFYAHHEATGTQVTGEGPLDLCAQIKAARGRHACTEPGAPWPLYQAGQM